MEGKVWRRLGHWGLVTFVLAHHAVRSEEFNPPDPDLQGYPHVLEGLGS